MGGAPAKGRQILGRIDEAMAQTRVKIRSYIKEHSEFEEIGERMLKEWGGRGRSVTAAYLVRLSDVVVPAAAHVCALYGVARPRFQDIALASRDKKARVC